MSTAKAMELLQRGDAKGADGLLRLVLLDNPRDFEALHLSAGVRWQMGDHAGALTFMERALAIDSSVASAHFNHGNLLLKLERNEEAAAAYDRAIKLVPHYADAWLNRAGAMRLLGRDEEVVRSCDQALKYNEHLFAAHNDRAIALARLDRHEEALVSIGRAIALEPNRADAYVNRGLMLIALERYDAAVHAYQTATNLDPDYAAAWNNLGVALIDAGRRGEAIAAYERAAQAPAARQEEADNPLFNKALILLAQDDWPEGFRLHEHRFAAGMAVRDGIADAIPEWTGGAVNGVLHVWGEQGVGDQLLFLRLLPLVLKRTRRVRVTGDARLTAMLRRAFPELDAGSEAPKAQIAMGSLARVLQITPDAVAGLPVVMSADNEKAAQIRARYEAVAHGKPLIGIAWNSPAARHGKQKSAGLTYWGALLKREAFFVSLQYGAVRPDIAAARGAFGCSIAIDDSIDQMASIEDFAAQIAALDRVVTVSNTTAHVAGAIGAKCVVMVPPARGLHWYWGLQGNRTPWYPSLRLIRREVGAPWDDQIARAAALALSPT